MKDLIGKKLLAIRPMTELDCRLFGFPPYGYEGNAVLMFEGGVQLVASQDYEGNGPGAFFGRKGREHFSIVFVQESVPRRDILKELKELEAKSKAIKEKTNAKEPKRATKRSRKKKPVKKAS